MPLPSAPTLRLRRAWIASLRRPTVRREALRARSLTVVHRADFSPRPTQGPRTGRPGLRRATGVTADCAERSTPDCRRGVGNLLMRDAAPREQDVPKFQGTFPRRVKSLPVHPASDRRTCVFAKISRLMAPAAEGEQIGRLEADWVTRDATTLGSADAYCSAGPVTGLRHNHLLGKQGGDADVRGRSSEAGSSRLRRTSRALGRARASRS